MPPVIAGIGSRRIDPLSSKLLKSVADLIFLKGCKLRSGGATGCDSIFEEAFLSDPRRMEIFLPEDGFNGRYISQGDHYKVIEDPRTIDFVKRFHGKPSKLSPKGWLLMRRNTFQVLGQSLDEPVDAVFCWTPSGEVEGGTGQAMRIAYEYNIPVFNMRSQNSYKKSLDFLNNL